MAKQVASDGEARTIIGPSKGFCDATTSTTAEYVDLSAYIGQYIKIYCETVDHYFAFGAATGFTIPLTAVAMTAEVTGEGSGGTLAGPTFSDADSARVPELLPYGGTGVEVVVPKATPWLGYKTSSGTGVIRVLRR